MPDDTPNSPPGQVPFNEEEAPGTASPDVASPATSSDAPASEIFESEVAKARRARQTIQLQKRAAFLLDLLKRFDTLIFAQLAFLYYLEASLPRLLIRLFTHTTLLSPSNVVPPPLPGQKAYTHTILFSNLFIILLHIFCALPQPHHGSRGFLHGGIWPDFIGQRPPTSRLYLLGLDVLVMGLQFVMLAVREQGERVKTALKGKREMDEYLAQERGEVRAQGDIESGDLEAAERGEVGRPGFAPHGDETRSLMASLTDEEGRLTFPGRPRARTIDSEEPEEELGREEPVYEPEGGPLDEYVSGNLMLGEFHVIHTAKELWRRHKGSGDQSLMAAGYTGGFYLRRARNRVTAAANAAGV